MTKYKNLLQESFRTYDNPLDEKTSKLILSYLRFYGYIPQLGFIRYQDGSYRIDFSNGKNIASLHFGENIALLTEYDGLTDAITLSRMNFIKKERLEYLGDSAHRSIVKTIDNFKTSLYYGPNNYVGMKKEAYLNNNIRKDIMPDDFKDLSKYESVMMRIVASGDYANEIRAKKIGPSAYYGRQF